MTNRRQALGRAGEERAAAWYRDHGYRVVARNWRCREGELDLILVKGRSVVVCEVKTRSSAAFGLPAEAVTATKQQRIRRLTAAWLRETRVHPSEIRFDVAAVLGPDLEIIEGAF